MAHCNLVSALLYARRMSTFDKKTPHLETPAQEGDTEHLLLERLRNSRSGADYFRWLLFVVGFYRGVQKTDAAKALLERFIETTNNDEQKAYSYLTLGQIATDEQRFEAALGHFNTALGFNPKQKKIAYVLHNNAAYCLNALHCYTEGERHCLMAIEINWTRASGYRNLGISLRGQGKMVEAGWAWVEATRLDASDERARVLLRTLIEENPEIALHCPWIVEGLTPNANSELTLRN
jgi:tetratricopeptide (TPR) repeat protein